MDIEKRVKEFFLNISFNRGVGRTTALREAAKKINGLFIVNQRQNKGDIVWDSDRLIGETRPLIFDHFAYEEMIKAISRKIEDLRFEKIAFIKTIDKMHLENNELYNRFNKLGIKYALLLIENEILKKEIEELKK